MTDSTITPATREETRAYYGKDYYGRPRFSKIMKYFDVPGTVLDLGCNDGVFLNVLRDHGIDGLGIDYDPAAVETCQRHGLDARRADIFEFTNDPDNEGQYAGVMLADFVEHFDPHPLQTLLRQCVRMLKPGAPMVIITPNSHSIQMNMGGFYESTIEHHNPYSLLGLRNFLVREQMEVIEEGVDPDSRYPLLTVHPARLLRNLTLYGMGRVLCGRDCWYEASYMVARRI